MSDYPDPDEEFELLHQDEYDLLLEQDSGEPVTSRRSLDFGPSQVPANNSVTEDATQLETQEAPRKRSIQELFGDIDDILYEDRNKRTRFDESDEDLIKHILELREEKKKELHLPFIQRARATRTQNSDNFSYRIPRYPFIGVTRSDGQKIYVRFHSETYEKDEIKRVASNLSFQGLIADSFKETWRQANELIEASPATEVNFEAPKESGQLWVDLYKPKKYLELLSDESTNRTLLEWIKLWDKVVFNRRIKIKPQVEIQPEKFKKFKKYELKLKLDDTGRPQFKVVLIGGPPGLGKTTLAHMVAKHAGYNVVEINASDDRSVEKFKTILENSTQMKSVLDRDNKPNCLIFDEIDGAPTVSIDFLVKYIEGAKNNQKGKKQNFLKRPIICICNDMYVPALRPLRLIAFVINLPPTVNVRLVQRLNEIARHQEIKTDIGALMALCEKTNNDIRSCLSALHFFKSLDKHIGVSDVYKSTVGQKDVQKELFAVWQEIFQIKRQKNKVSLENAQSKEREGCDNRLKGRMSRILSTVHSYGDCDRLAQGIFENYPNMNVNSSLESTCEALEWFSFNDVLNRNIHSGQNFSLCPYLEYGFVVWHFAFASRSWQKLNFPSTGYEVKTKIAKQAALIAEVLKGAQPATRAYLSRNSLKMDVLPFLVQLISPTQLRSNLHAYVQLDKNQMSFVVDIMIDYNLNYVEEKHPEGHYVYNLDPNVEEIALFPIGKQRWLLNSQHKQQINREIEMAKMRKWQESKGAKQVAKKIARTKGIVAKDFFGRIVTKESSGGSGSERKNSIWYSYKEGYSNAVRRPVKIESLK